MHDYQTPDIPEYETNRTRAIWQKHANDLKLKAGIIAAFLITFWALEIVDWLTPWWNMDWWGIHPLEIQGLYGIPLAPFLHADFPHLLANTLPFAFLGFLIVVRSVREFLAVTVAITIGGGIGIWLFGGLNTIHIGASILVFGYLGFLLASGIFERKVATIGRSLAVFLLYYSLLAGIVPAGPGISWQGHLFGLLAGAFAAYLLGKRRANRAKENELSGRISVYHDDAIDV
jgi:membrane associated rhomboid family serine protease